MAGCSLQPPELRTPSQALLGNVATASGAAFSQPGRRQRAFQAAARTGPPSNLAPGHVRAWRGLCADGERRRAGSCSHRRAFPTATAPAAASEARCPPPAAAPTGHYGCPACPAPPACSEAARAALAASVCADAALQKLRGAVGWSALLRSPGAAAAAAFLNRFHLAKQPKQQRWRQPPPNKLHYPSRKKLSGQTPPHRREGGATAERHQSRAVRRLLSGLAAKAPCSCPAPTFLAAEPSPLAPRGRSQTREKAGEVTRPLVGEEGQ